MSKKIKNEETKVRKHTSLNDTDILNDTLLSFKFLVDNYAIALNEASNKWIYDTYKNIFDELSKTQQQLFQLSFQKQGRKNTPGIPEVARFYFLTGGLICCRTPRRLFYHGKLAKHHRILRNSCFVMM